MSHSINITRIKAVYNALGDLGNEVVFVGGATVSLYADNPEQADIRPTNDVDVLVEVATYGSYVQVQEKLSKLGFQVDADSKVICRYKYQGLTVDVMPIEEDVLGFKSRWYKEGFENRVKHDIDEQTAVNIFTAPYFIAAKIEAFKDRGKNDGRTSTDFEDIIFVLDNMAAIWKEMKNAKPDLNEYLQTEFKKLSGNRYIEEWISGHLERNTASARSKMILTAIDDFLTP